MRTFALMLGILACLALSGAEPAGKPAGGETKYLFVTPATPGGIVPAALEKGLRIAFLFDPGQKEWLKVVVPALKGTKPLLFVRGDLKPEETAYLKKILDQLDYEALVIHAKLTAGDSLGPVPLTDLITIERVVDIDHGWVDYDLRRGGKPERGILQGKQDAQDFTGDTFGVAGGMVFKQAKVALVNLDRPGASIPKGMNIVVIFSADPEKAKGVLK